MIINEKELLKEFPEAQKVISEKLEEWNNRKNKINQVCADVLKIGRLAKDEFTYWFLKAVIFVFYNNELGLAEKHIARLKRLESFLKNEKPNARTIDELKQISIIDFIATATIRSGHNQVKTVCPFHNEKTPSFVIYVDQNSCWCFGCQRGGSVIDFVMIKNNLELSEALKFLEDYA